MKIQSKIAGIPLVVFYIAVTVTAFADESGRRLDVSDENVSVEEVTRYFSTYLHGPTQQFYHLRDQNAVVTIRIGNESTAFDPTIAVNVFATDAVEENISEWINNQHSDGIYFGAAEPTDVYELSHRNFSIESCTRVGQVTGSLGDEYDTYELEISVDDVSVDGLFDLTGFVARATVHVLTRGIDE